MKLRCKECGNEKGFHRWREQQVFFDGEGNDVDGVDGRYLGTSFTCNECFAKVEGENDD
jgi:hypothetical protein